MTKTQIKEETKPSIQEVAEDKKTLSVEKILRIQVGDYLGHDYMYFGLACISALAFFGSQRQIAEVVWPVIYNCLTPDVDPDGKTRWQLQPFFVPESEPNECKWLPTIPGYGHFRFTYLQFYLFDVICVTTPTFLLMSAA
mmetsp:Transcript_17219/g.26597  ORF Transcript_17219/g.26597 Transcript_17219/m.26597 type:complete len:140 (+) Transcript_17219:21-440(+)